MSKKYQSMGKYISNREAARRLGISEASVRDMRKKSDERLVICPTNNKIDWDKTSLNFPELRRSESERLAAVDVEEKLLAAKMRKMQLEADKIQNQIASTSNQYVSREEVLTFFSSFSTKLLDKLQELPVKVGSYLVGLSEGEIESVLSDYIKAGVSEVRDLISSKLQES